MFIDNLQPGTICISNISWEGDGDISLFFTGDYNIQTDDMGHAYPVYPDNINKDDFQYKFKNGIESSFEVSQDGIYAFPLRDVTKYTDNIAFNVKGIVTFIQPNNSKIIYKIQ